MHESALDRARIFREYYLNAVEDTPLTILDVGSAVVDGQAKSNRMVMTNPVWKLIGLDIVPGINVDVVVAEPYNWREIATASIDVVTCSDVFEHAEWFWLTMLEIKRVLKQNGVAFITAPSGGPLHRWPVDCWRFYDDGLPAVARYAGLTTIDAQVQWVPIYRKGSQWRDASIVVQRPASTPEEEREALTRIALAKLAIAEGVTPERIASAVEAARSEAVSASPIPPLVGRNAFAEHERRLLDGTPTMVRKAQLVMRRLREAARIVKTPFGELRA